MPIGPGSERFRAVPHRRPWQARAALRVLFGALFCISLNGCTSREPAAFVDLDDVEESPATPSANREPGPSLRVAVSSIISPSDTHLLYHEFMDYLGEKSNRQVVLKQRRTYGEVNALLARGELDLAFLCSAQYVETHDRFGARLLAVPVVDGKTVYRSYIIADRLSGIDSLEGLRGKKFAFVDPLSNTGHLVPTYLLALQGERPDSFFDSYVFTDSHDNSIRAVSEGLVDGAAVDSMVYDYMAASAPDLLRGTRIIQRSQPFGIPPVVVPSDIDPDLEADLREWLLSMHEEPNGRAILQQLSIERFVLGDDSDYDDIRKMQAFLASRGDDSRDAGAPRE